MAYLVRYPARVVGERGRQRVARAFEAWAAIRGFLPADSEGRQVWRDRIEIILQGRGEYLGRPDATLWRSGDVHRVLMDHLVPRQNDAWGLAEHGVETLRRFLEFLDDTERLHPRSTKVTTLLKELDRAAPGFPAAMADTSRYRLAKRVWTAMRADGLSDDSDPAEIDRWAERFSTLDADGRRPVLGELLDENPEYAFARLLVHGGEVALLKPGMPADKRLIWPDAGECDCGCADRETPVPEGLPTERELGAAVAGSTLLQRLSALGAWASAQGRPVDRRGEPLRKELASVASAVGMAGAGARLGVWRTCRHWQCSGNWLWSSMCSACAGTGSAPETGWPASGPRSVAKRRPTPHWTSGTTSTTSCSSRSPR